MVKDFKYIIKRIIIGVGIVLAFMFIKCNLIMSVSALDYNADEYQVCGTGYGCTTQSTLPVTNSYGNELYGYYYTIPFTNGHTYSINFYISMYAKDLTINSGWPKMYLYTNNSTVTIVPDRYENLYVSYIGADRYAVTWSFELDVVGDFVGCQLTMKYNSSFQNTFTYTGIHDMQLSITDLTITGGSSNDDIINNNNQNTQSIINNQNNNTNNIINNNTQNTQEIIDNQNENTQKEIDSQKVCKMIDKDSVFKPSYYLAANGSEQTGSQSWVSNLGISDYFSTTGSTFKVLVGFTQANYCFYNVNKSLISCSSSTNLTVGQNVSIPSNASFVRFTIGIPTNQPQIEWCQNGNQALQDSLTDDSGVSNKEIDDLFGDLKESNSPVSDLLTLPITLLQAYLTGFDSTCSPYNFGSLYGTNLILPCINIESYIGSSLWSIIDALCCIYMIYNIAMMCVSIYESFTSLDDQMQLLYTPQHHGHTRVSRNEANY